MIVHVRCMNVFEKTGTVSEQGSLPFLCGVAVFYEYMTE